jgi:hypothetical protein
MTIYVDIDINNSPDLSWSEHGFVLYVLRPPGETYPMSWNDDESVEYELDSKRFKDMDEAEEFICLGLGLDLRRAQDGCYARKEPPPDNIREILAKHDIVVNRIGEKLDEYC